MPSSKIVVPSQSRNMVIANFHGPRLGGHFKPPVLCHTILQRFWWPSLTVDCDLFVRACHSCYRQQDRTTAKNRRPLQPLPPAEYKGERVSGDLMGPFRISTNGNKYLLTMCDHYTRFSLLIPIKDKTAPIVAQAILERYICQLGHFRLLQTDSGSEFVNAELRGMLDMMKIAHHQCSAHHAQSNGLEERSHSIINNYFRIYLEEAQGQYDWESLVPYVQHCVNQRVCSTSGASPWFLMFGEWPVNPCFPMDRPMYAENDTANRIRLMNYARKLTVDNNIQAKKRWKLYYDKKARASDFKPDDFVLLHRPAPPGTVVKHWTSWRGPFQIVAKVGPENYTVRRRGCRILKVHAQNIKPFDPINAKNGPDTLLSNYDIPPQFQQYGNLKTRHNDQEEEEVEDQDEPLPLSEVAAAMAKLPLPFIPLQSPYPVRKG